jgi:hypothetical protein
MYTHHVMPGLDRALHARRPNDLDRYRRLEQTEPIRIASGVRLGRRRRPQ